MKNDGYAVLVALIAALLALFAGAGPLCAQEAAGTFAAGPLVRIETRFLDDASGAEVGWGATGQVLVPLQPADSALQHRWRVRAVATSPARQGLTLAPGGRGLIRVGRDIPFAGWFLRHGTNCGWLEAGTEWREVESALEIEALSVAADGTLYCAITPEFSYLSGRSRRAVSFPGERVEILLTPGAEVRFVPSAATASFYNRLFAGYGPVRRVWRVALVLGAYFVDPEEPGDPAQP